MGHVFISYSHKDTKYAHRLADELQEKGIEVWIDERLDYGSTWPQEIQKQLDSCDVFVIVMSPRSYESDWVQNELNRAKRLGKLIFPLLLEGDGPWLSVESTQYLDVRGGKFPDEKFYSTIERTVTNQDKKAVLSQPRTGTVNLSPKLKTGIVIAIVGILIVLLASLGSNLGSYFSRAANPPSVTTQSLEVPFVSSKDASNTRLSPTSASEIQNETPNPVEMADLPEIPMQLVPAGEFMMGSNNAVADERPVHTVYLDAYYMDIYEVTNGLYKICVDAGVCTPPGITNSLTRSSYYGNPEFNDYPVISVNWNQAKTFCEWRGVSLPTEAQWEKAARGTDGRKYPWDNEIDCDYVNFYDVLGVGQCVSDTTKVGSYESGISPYGMYDMAGNVMEWVADWYDPNYYASSPSSNPLGPDSGKNRVLRGGTWGSTVSGLRTSIRIWYPPDFQGVDFGFRCAIDAAP